MCDQPMHRGKSEICMTVKEAGLLMVGMFSRQMDKIFTTASCGHFFEADVKR